MNTIQPRGQIAAQLGHDLTLEVLSSGAGFYLGTFDEDGPVSRESEYFPTREAANEALASESWQQRTSP